MEVIRNEYIICLVLVYLNHGTIEVDTKVYSNLEDCLYQESLQNRDYELNRIASLKLDVPLVKDLIKSKCDRGVL